MSTLRISEDLSLPLDIVTEATAIVATRGAGKSSTGAVLVEEAIAADVPVVVIDWTGVFWGLRSSTTGKSAGLGIYVLGGPKGDVPLEASAGVVIADLVVDSGHSFVLDLSDFTKGQMRRFCADFLERLYDRKARARTTLLLLIDEAHELAPQSPRGGFKGDAARLISAMEQVAALGRSRGIGVVMITQRTQALNKAVLDLIETLLVMRMLSPRAVAAVRDWIGTKNEDDEQGVLASLPQLKTGTAWVWSPLRGILQKIAIRRIHTFDSYATPKPGETRVEPTARKELDLAQLGEQMAATVERAKADDPQVLRATIAGLERDLAAERAKPPPETEPEIVEVPVLDDELADRLDRAVHHLDEVLEHGRQRLDQLLEDTRKDLTEVANALAILDDSHWASITAAAVPVSPPPVPPKAPPVPRARPADPPSDSDVPPARRKLLDALVSLEAIGVHEAPKPQLALFAGVSPKSSGYQNNLGALRSAGLIEYPGPGLVQITSEGREYAADTPPPTSNAELHTRVQELLPPGRWRLLEPLLDAYPQALDRDELADQVGVSPTSSGYQNNLGALRSLGLIDYPDRGQVAANDVLFLGGTR